MKNKVLCRHCKIFTGTMCDCKHKRPDGTFRRYFSCRACQTKRLKQYRDRNKQKIRSIVKKYETNNKTKVLCWAKIKQAVKNKTIKKPVCCEVCGQGKKLDAHHKDYTKPLEVMWLCRTCHKNLHKIQKGDILEM